MPDGVPENTALGVSLAEESITLLVAIFASNLPESLVGANAMRDGGRSPRYAIGIWAGAALLLAAAVVVGKAVATAVEPATISLLLLAGGAVLASLGGHPDARGLRARRPWNAFATAAGFVLSFALAGG